MAIVDELKQIADMGKKIVIDCNSEFGLKADYSAKIDEKVQSFLSGDKPRLLVCGVYSAGKSTLINVINKAEVAEVGAQPKTDKISEYDNGDFVIIDSPGVDAPIQHEEITDAYVEKSNALMFVVSGKNAESEANYRKIKQWMKYEKPLMIVLNDKTGELDFDSDVNVACRRKIEENLRRVNCELKSKYEVITVDAKTAWEGLKSDNIETREVLYKHSNMPQLESMISSKMHDAKALYMAPIGELVRVFDEIENELGLIAYGYDDSKLLDELGMLEQESKRIIKSVNGNISEACENGKQKIISACMNGANQETINEVCQQVSSEIGNKIDEDFSNQVGRLSEVINDNFKDLGISMTKEGQITIAGFNVDCNELSKIKNSDSPELECALYGAEVGAFLGKKLTESVITTATTVATSALGSAAAGTIGGMAGLALTTTTIPILTTAVSTLVPAVGGGALAGAGAGAFAGPIGAIIGAGVGLVAGRIISRKRQEKMAEQLEAQNEERQRAMDEYYKRLESEVSTKMYATSTEFTKVADAMIIDSFNKIKELINQKIAQGKDKNDQVLNYRKQVAEIKQQLNAMVNNL